MPLDRSFRCIKCKLGTCSDRRAAVRLRFINKHDWSPRRDYLVQFRSAAERTRGGHWSWGMVFTTYWFRD